MLTKLLKNSKGYSFNFPIKIRFFQGNALNFVVIIIITHITLEELRDLTNHRIFVKYVFANTFWEDNNGRRLICMFTIILSSTDAKLILKLFPAPSSQFRKSIRRSVVVWERMLMMKSYMRSLKCKHSLKLSLNQHGALKLWSCTVLCKFTHVILMNGDLN